MDSSPSKPEWHVRETRASLSEKPISPLISSKDSAGPCPLEASKRPFRSRRLASVPKEERRPARTAIPSSSGFEPSLFSGAEIRMEGASNTTLPRSILPRRRDRIRGYKVIEPDLASTWLVPLKGDLLKFQTGRRQKGPLEFLPF